MVVEVKRACAGCRVRQWAFVSTLSSTAAAAAAAAVAAVALVW